MKTKFYFLVISFLAICSVCLPACDNDEKGDVTKPVIDLIFRVVKVVVSWNVVAYR